jgi:DNA-binding NarL/FixJ family response regulator
MSRRRPARVLVVDDHPLVRRGLREVLDAVDEIAVTGEAASYERALECLEQEPYDLAIVDIGLAGQSGLELTKQLRERYPEVLVLVCSLHDEVLFAERSLRAGARGYLSKDEAVDRVVEAVERVLDGRIYLSPEMTDRLLAVSAGQSGGRDEPLERLSDRELEVFGLVGQALSSSEIGERLNLSPKTVDSHRENIKKKLGLKNHGELLRRAVQWVLEQD